MTKANQIYHRQQLAWIESQRTRIAHMESEMKRNRAEIEYRQSILKADSKLLALDKQALKEAQKTLAEFKRRVK